MTRRANLKLVKHYVLTFLILNLNLLSNKVDFVKNVLYQENVMMAGVNKTWLMVMGNGLIGIPGYIFL